MLPNNYGPARGEVLEKCTVPFRKKNDLSFIYIYIYIYRFYIIFLLACHGIEGDLSPHGDSRDTISLACARACKHTAGE